MTVCGLEYPTAVMVPFLRVDLALKEQRLRSFLERVERARREGEYRRTWLVVFRLRSRSSVPPDSPFWALAASLNQGGVTPALAANPALTASAGFWAGHGAESPDPQAIVAFENREGSLARVEALATFLE